MKLLIAEACLVLSLGGERAEHADVNETVNVSKEDAHYLTRAGRAYYIDRDDDPTKGPLTANKEDLASIAKQASAIKESQKAANLANSPQDAAALMREAVAQGMADGMARGMAAAAEAQRLAGSQAPAGKGGTS